MKDKELIKVEEEKVSIFRKIARFFKKIFEKKEQPPQKELTEIEKSKQNFWKNIKIEENLEDAKLLELQRKINNKEVKPEDLSIEEIESLTALYNRQTERIVRKIEEIEAETQIINDKIARLNGKNVDE